MLCISWIMKCLIIIDAQCKHEDSIWSLLQTANIFVCIGKPVCRSVLCGECSALFLNYFRWYKELLQIVALKTFFLRRVKNICHISFTL